jgi:hypothetical protein
LNEFMKRLEERKQEYNASGRGNKPRADEEEDERMRSLSLMKSGAIADSPYHNVDGIYLPSSYGADIQAEEAFQQELHGIVDDMKAKLVNEKKILEGTLNPEYGKGDWSLPNIKMETRWAGPGWRPEQDATEEFRKSIEKPTWPYDGPQDLEYGKGEWRTEENELSNSKPTEEQWKNDSQNGSLITVHIPISTQESNNSACIAELFNRGCPIARSDDKSTPSSTDSCSGKSADSGTETDAMNESSECTVPMISAAMLGTPSEVRWSPPPRSMEYSVPNLLDARS